MSSRRIFSSPSAEEIARSVQKTILLTAVPGFTQRECLFLLELANLRPPVGASLDTLRTLATNIIAQETIDPLKLEIEA